MKPSRIHDFASFTSCINSRYSCSRLGGRGDPPHFGEWPRTKVVTDEEVSVATSVDNMGGHFPWPRSRGHGCCLVAWPLMVNTLSFSSSSTSSSSSSPPPSSSLARYPETSVVRVTVCLSYLFDVIIRFGR